MLRRQNRAAKKNIVVVATENNFRELVSQHQQGRPLRVHIAAWLNPEKMTSCLEPTAPQMASSVRKTDSVTLRAFTFSATGLVSQELSSFSEVARFIGQNPVEEIVFQAEPKTIAALPLVVAIAEKEGIPVRIQVGLKGRILKGIRVEEKGKGFISLCLPMNREKKGALLIKRLIDVTCSILLLLLLSPLFLLIALLIKITSAGPVFYEWNVVGQHKKPFRSWKFRTMIKGADAMKPLLQDKNIMKGPVFKIRNDPRVTWIGRFLRKYSLDELPQLWSVLKGDMSLVGPRPAGHHELANYKDWQRRRLSIKPGITCLWQVSGRNLINDFDEWAKLDLEYIDNWSLWLDIKILFKTVKAILKGTGF
ncbi:MAG: exopolysaccharide biosynthesis polyprenyl glycosylphosphotransferase [Candidatus Aminicenantales bacterium]